MSLNFSQPVSNPAHKKRSKKHYPNSGFSQGKLDLIVDFTHRYLAETGRVPSKQQIADGINYNYPSTCRAWRHLVAVGRLSSDLDDQVEIQKLDGPKVTANQHTGKCSPETATKLFNLIKNDMEARIAFFELLRGNS